jgi:hypothetical protein
MKILTNLTGKALRVHSEINDRGFPGGKPPKKNSTLREFFDNIKLLFTNIFRRILKINNITKHFTIKNMIKHIFSLNFILSVVGISIIYCFKTWGLSALILDWMVDICNSILEAEYKVEFKEAKEWAISAVIGLIVRISLKGVLEAIMIDLNLEAKDLIPKFIRDKFKLDVDFSKPFFSSGKMPISDMLNPDTPPIERQPGAASGSTSTPNESSATRAKVTKEAANAAGKVAAEKAAISWSGLTDVKDGYTLNDGVVRVPIPQDTKFCLPLSPDSNKLEANTSPSAVNATLGLYNALLDQKAYFTKRGVKHAAFNIPPLHPDTYAWLNQFVSFQKQDTRLEIQGRYGMYNSETLRKDLYYFLKQRGVQNLRRVK